MVVVIHVNMPPLYKLTYLDFRGRADLIRLLFVAGGVEFEDVRISFEELADLKDNTPFGRLPILQFDGITLAESKAIARYVAKETNQYGKGHLEQAQVDMIVDLTDDIMNGMMKACNQKNETDRKEMMAEFVNEGSLKTFAHLEKMLAANNGGKAFFVGDTMTMADLHFYVLSEAVLKSNPSGLDNFSNLKALLKRVENIPLIAAWLPSRPKKFACMF